MSSLFSERHQDYVLGPNQDSRLASIAAGAIVPNLTMQLDYDAPFALRGRAYRVKYDNTTTQTGLNSVALRYSGPLRDWRQQGYVPQNLVMPYGGQGGAWSWLRNQIVYPAGGQIQIDLVNTGATSITNLKLYWRGVKLYPAGINPASTYPRDCRTIPFTYPINPVTVGNPYGVIQNLAVVEPGRLLQQFQCANDADFVLRYGQAGPSFAPFGTEVEMILRDENRKPYSNDYVHVELLFGPSRGNYSCGGTSIGAVGTGNSLPSCFYPEIYVKKNHILYYDIIRNDTGYPGAASIPSYPVNLIGSKVYS